MKSTDMKHNYAPGTSRPRQTAASLRHRMARELEQLLAQGTRLRELRRPISGSGKPGGRTRYEVTQQAVADAVGVTLRAYQAWEAGESDIEWTNLQALGHFHDVDPRWIVEGDRGPTQLEEIAAEIADVKAMLALVVDHLGLEHPAIPGAAEVLAGAESAAQLLADASAQTPPEATPAAPRTPRKQRA